MDNQAYSSLQQSALHVSTLPSNFIHAQVCPTPLLSFSNVLSFEFHFSYRPEKFDQLANEHITIATSVTVST